MSSAPLFFASKLWRQHTAAYTAQKTKQNWLLINALSSTDSWPEGWCFTRCRISNLVYVGMFTTLEIIQKTWGCLSYLVLLLFVTLLSPCPVFCFFLLSFFPPHFSRHAPCRETINPYYVNTGHVMAPATSANDSEQQSMSSDADTISLTDSSVYVFWLHPIIQTFHTQLYQLKKAMQVTTFRGMTVLPSPIK